MTASVVRLAERIRSLTPDRQIAAIATDVDGLGVLARTTAEAQRATGEAMGVLADATTRIAEVQAEHGAALARIEESLAATQLYAMRAEAVARRIETQVRPAPAWNRPVKAAFGLVSAVALLIAGGFASDPRPYLEALERWFR